MRKKGFRKPQAAWLVLAALFAVGAEGLEPVRVEPALIEARIVSVPAFPKDGRWDKLEGRAILELQIDAAGKLTGSSVNVSSGSEEVDAAAREYVTGFVFQPAMRGEVPVAATKIVKVAFSQHE